MFGRKKIPEYSSVARVDIISELVNVNGNNLKNSNRGLLSFLIFSSLDHST